MKSALEEGGRSGPMAVQPPPVERPKRSPALALKVAQLRLRYKILRVFSATMTTVTVITDAGTGYVVNVLLWRGERTSTTATGK